MGVIKRVENLFEVRCSVSEETLYLPSSDDEARLEADFPEGEVDDGERRQAPRIARQRPPPVGSSFPSLKTRSGKKKFRRYHNASQLVTLAEEDELKEVTIEDFIVSSKSPFSRLLEDDQSLQKWDEFVSSSEEKQRKILEAAEKKKGETGYMSPQMNRGLRNLLRKKNLPLGMVQYLEQELISFFLAEPAKTYISPVLSSFERLILHLVSSFHRFVSISFTSEPDNVKLVRVKNPKKIFSVPELLLVQYLETTNHGPQ